LPALAAGVAEPHAVKGQQPPAPQPALALPTLATEAARKVTRIASQSDNKLFFYNDLLAVLLSLWDGYYFI